MNSSSYISILAIAAGLLVGGSALGWFRKKTPSEIAEAALFVEPRANDFVNANIIHSIMRQCFRVHTISNLLNENSEQYQSDEDFLRLYTAFGRRGYDKCVTGLPQWLYTQMDLFEYMRQVASSEERAAVNEYFDQNNITFNL